MAGQNYYLITALPPLGELGSVPPLTSHQLLEHVAQSPSAEAAIKTLFLADDLLQREALLAGETQDATPAVLSAQQVRNEEPLPAYLLAAEGEKTHRPIAADRTWEGYFRHAGAVAAKTHNAFLASWVGYEVGLRNALAAHRARALGLEEADYLVATDLAEDDEDFAVVVNEWSAATNPLAGLRVLDRARWSWLTQHERWFSFADDELAAYAARLMLLQRWQRLTTEAESQESAQEKIGV